MKALKLLYQYQQAYEIAGGYTIKPLDEAIKELEELENRSCIGCVNLTRSNSQDCISCSRQYQDNFKIIKNNLKITNI